MLLPHASSAPVPGGFPAEQEQQSVLQVIHLILHQQFRPLSLRICAGFKRCYGESAAL